MAREHGRFGESRMEGARRKHEGDLEPQLDKIEEKWGKTPLSLWNDPRMVTKVIAWRDSRAAAPPSGDIGVMVLSRLLEFGRLVPS
jgi:hypothetical protein